MMIEAHWQVEFASQLVRQRIAIERWSKIHSYDRSLVGIDHGAHRDAYAERFRAAPARADRMDFLIAWMIEPTGLSRSVAQPGSRR